MQLELTSDEASGLYDALLAYLPELRREVAATDQREFRHSLVERLDACERVLARLAATRVQQQP